MKALPDIDILKCYEHLSHFKHNIRLRYFADNLLDFFKSSNNLLEQREYLYFLLQIYFDHLVAFPVPEWEGSDQKTVLDDLLQAGVIATGSFYRGEGIPAEQVKELILPHADLLRRVEKPHAKLRHLAHKNHWRYVYDLGKKIEQSFRQIYDYLAPCRRGVYIDVIVPIASGGFEPAFLAADVLEVDCIVPLVSSRVSRGYEEVKTPTMDQEYDHFKGKTVLVVEDIVSSGRTIDLVVDYVKAKEPTVLYGVAVELEIPFRKYAKALVEDGLPCRMDRE